MYLKGFLDIINSVNQEINSLFQNQIHASIYPIKGVLFMEKKIDALGKIGSKNFDWLTWENLTDESARLYSELSLMDDILKVVRNQIRK